MKSYVLRISAKDKAIFDAIKSGKKKVETRAGSVRYQKVVVGDTLVFSCAGKKLEKKVGAVRHFKTLAGMLRKYKPQDINPAVRSTKELILMYHAWPGYEQKIRQYGLIVFEIV